MEQIAAPFVGPSVDIKPEWIDFNGHLNAGYYFVVFDDAVGPFMEFVGLGPDHRAEHDVTTFSLEGHITFNREMKLDDPIEIRTQLLGYDAKKMHFINLMFHATEGWLAATNELLSIHISLETRRSAPMAPAVLDRLADVLAAHQPLDVPEQVGNVIGLTR